MDILNEKIAGLVKKAEKSGMPYGILKKVYDRGMAAWKTGHRPGTTPQQWAFARVNSFVTKSSGTWGKADKDLADKVRGAKKEEIENPKKAKDIVGQVREKLGKDADAGDYVKDFRKSKAPQFKGKSDKKIQKMAIAAYLDSKEEVELDESKDVRKKYKGKEQKSVDKLIMQKGVDKVQKFHDKNPREFDNMVKRLAMLEEVKEENCPKCDNDPCKCENIQESGHTDVASMKTQVQIAMDALQKMNMELGKLGNEDDLPTWWTNKVATAVNKLDGMADYIDAIHDKGETMSEEVNLEEGRMKELAGYIARGMSAQAIAKKMKIDVKTIEKLMKEDEVELDEQKVFVFRYEYKGKRYAAPFKSEKDAKDAMKAAMTDKNVKNASMTQDILKRGVKFAEDVEIVEFIDEAVLAGRDYNYDGKSPIKISKKMYAKVQRDSKSMIKGKPYMMALNPKTQGTELVPVVFEEVDNSLAAQATRVISQTAIREKKDPADIDMTATDLDRKAADKNIFVQLKRAQDMKGKGDIEFLDKKKKKVDIRIINKAIDMMMKMKPADRAKMQTAIGKSYRDLLKTVQRGKV